MLAVTYIRHHSCEEREDIPAPQQPSRSLAQGVPLQGGRGCLKRHAGGVLPLPKRYAFDDLLEILQQFEGPIERGENAPAQKRKF